MKPNKFTKEYIRGWNDSTKNIVSVLAAISSAVLILIIALVIA